VSGAGESVVGAGQFVGGLATVTIAEGFKVVGDGVEAVFGDQPGSDALDNSLDQLSAYGKGQTAAGVINMADGVDTAIIDQVQEGADYGRKRIDAANEADGNAVFNAFTMEAKDALYKGNAVGFIQADEERLGRALTEEETQRALDAAEGMSDIQLAAALGVAGWQASKTAAFGTKFAAFATALRSTLKTTAKVGIPATIAITTSAIRLAGGTTASAFKSLLEYIVGESDDDDELREATEDLLEEMEDMDEEDLVPPNPEEKTPMVTADPVETKDEVEAPAVESPAPWSPYDPELYKPSRYIQQETVY
jgi:hypothetical protein